MAHGLSHLAKGTLGEKIEARTHQAFLSEQHHSCFSIPLRIARTAATSDLIFRPPMSQLQYTPRPKRMPNRSPRDDTFTWKMRQPRGAIVRLDDSSPTFKITPSRTRMRRCTRSVPGIMRQSANHPPPVFLRQDI